MISQDCVGFTRWGGGTGVRELMRGQATLPQKVDPGAFNAQRQVWKTPKRTLLVDPPALHDIYIYISYAYGTI